MAMVDLYHLVDLNFRVGDKLRGAVHDVVW